MREFDVVREGRVRQEYRKPERDEHHLPGEPLEHDGPDATADVAAVLAVADGAVDVAEDAAGQRRVDEQRPVVVGDGRTQRQPMPRPRATRHQRQALNTVVSRPIPSAASQGPAVEQVHAVEECTGAQAPQQNARMPTPPSIRAQAQAARNM